MAKANNAKNSDFAFEIIEDNAKLTKAIASIAVRGKTLAKDTHIAACSVLHKVNCNGDVRIITDLLNAVHDMTRKNAIKAWFEYHGPVSFADNKVSHTKRDTKDLFDKACKVPFWSFSPEPEYVPLDISKMLNGLIKKLARDTDETGVQHAELTQTLTDFLAKREKALAAEIADAY